MSSTLTPAKVLLLAVHLSAHADVCGLEQLAAQHPIVLHKNVLLRILLTHLPETVRPEAYVDFLKRIDADHLVSQPELELDTSPVVSLSEHLASRKATKLHLTQLLCPDAPARDDEDLLGLFLFQRAHRMDSETGMLAHLPDLLTPFLGHSAALRTWTVSTVFPFVRRNVEYYTEPSPAYSLAQFQHLQGPDAVLYLLAPSLSIQGAQTHIGRDLRALLGPWLYENARWEEGGTADATANPGVHTSPTCPGWEKAMDCLASRATTSWKLVADAVEQWDGPADVFFGHGVSLKLPEPRQRYLEESYARAVLASSYMVQEATTNSLGASYRMCTRVRRLMGYGQGDPSLQDAVSALPDVFSVDMPNIGGAKATSLMRNDLLQSWNPLTSPSEATTGLLMTLALSAFVLTQFGVPCTVKRAGDLAFLGDEREQRSEAGKLFHAISSNAARLDGQESWIGARRQVLWLRDWGQPTNPSIPAAIRSVLATVPREHIESEFLKALLVQSHYALARTLFEDSQEKPLTADAVREIVFNSAMNAFDNASNPSRIRGGLKQCDDIIHAFPSTVSSALPGTKRIQALLRATHALSDYRLVLKQGEPFRPVVLRVHSDPISIIEKVLQQNPKAYTRLQEFIEMGLSMVRAGLPARDRSNRVRAPSTSEQDTDPYMTERRIVAMCIEAALREDDFETAYSYVASRLGTAGAIETNGLGDRWSWQAALAAGQYLRTDRSQQPTHLGTASGNPEIRHLEQRMECLATALRVAPTCQLQGILKTFRRCEEQLDSAIKEEAANEAAWDARADTSDIPGTFDAPAPGKIYPPRNMTAAIAARQAEEAPMSLFDLSRATARVAQRNLTRLSSLQGVVSAAEGGPALDAQMGSDSGRVRKRDQLRDAATGTLVSGVGWLIGAKVNQGWTETS